MKNFTFISLIFSFNVFASNSASWQARIDDFGCIMLIEPRFSEKEALECGEFCDVISQFAFMYPNNKAPILDLLKSEPMNLIHGATIATSGAADSAQILNVQVKIKDKYESLVRSDSDLYSGYLTDEIAEKAKKQLLKSGILSYKVNYSNGKSISYSLPNKFVERANEMFETCKRELNNHEV